MSHSKYVSLRLCETYMHHCEVSALWEYQIKKKILDGIHQGLSKHQKMCSTSVTKVLLRIEGTSMYTMTTTNGSNDRP